MKKANKRKVYFLKKQKGKVGIRLTIDDLTPIPHRKNYTFEQLVNMINGSNYETDWKTPMNEEHGQLYLKFNNCKYDFFKVKGMDLVVMPGTYLYATILTEDKIKELDRL